MVLSYVKESFQKMRKFHLNIFHWIFIIFFSFFLILQIGFLLSGKEANIIFNMSSIIINGLFWAALFLSIAIGLNLTYKILKFPNFAHAEYVTIGGFTAIFIQSLDIFLPGSSTQTAGFLRPHLLWIAIIIAFIMAGLLAMIADYFIFRKLRLRNANPDTMMIASLGLALVIRGLLYIRFSGAYQYFQPDEAIRRDTIEFSTIKIILVIGNNIFSSSILSEGLTYTAKTLNLVMVLFIMVVALLLFLFIQKTKLGKAMRAVSDDPGLAASSGINVNMIRNLSTFIGAGIAGMAGAFWSALFRFNPETGSLYLLAGFAVIVLGSIGNFRGAVIASFLIGFTRSFSEPILTWLGGPLERPSLTAYRDIVPFVLLIFVLLFFSEGVGSQFDKYRSKKNREKQKEEES